MNQRHNDVSWQGTSSERSHGLTPLEIVEQAKKVIAEVGVERFTIRRLIAKLGVSLGAIYKHVPNKHALLCMVARDLFDEIEPPPPSADWAEGCKVLLLRFQEIMSRYPGMMVFTMRHPRDLEGTRLRGYYESLLRDAGFTTEQMYRIIATMYFLMTGALITELPVAEQYQEVAELHVEQASVPMAQRFVESLDLLLRGCRGLLEENSRAELSTPR